MRTIYFLYWLSSAICFLYFSGNNMDLTHESIFSLQLNLYKGSMGVSKEFFFKANSL